MARAANPRDAAAGDGSGRAPAVVVTHELTPGDAAALDGDSVAAVACAAGAPLSHATILARALGIPVVTGLGAAVLDLPPGTVVLVDGDAGTVEIAPSPSAVEAAAARSAEARRRHDEARALATAPATTRDGHAVAVLANIGRVEEVGAAVENGADGVGMLRTEFVFLGRGDAPGEEEQYEAYCSVGDALGDRPLVIRTLDLGADIPAWGGDAEPNPALGQRGIRLALASGELLETQLRAVARAARHRALRVMFPMVTTVDELRRARACLDEVTAAALPPGLEVGITVEVPAAALAVEAFAPLVDFFAIGTNDLTQYTLATDRANASVADIADGLHPAVLRLIGEVAAAGERHRRPVEVVGELGTDPLAVPLLLGLGVDTLSVRPNAVAVVKQLIRQVALGEARQLAQDALAAESAEAVRALAAGHRTAAERPG